MAPALLEWQTGSVRNEMAAPALLNTRGGAEGATDGDERCERRDEESQIVLTQHVIAICSPRV